MRTENASRWLAGFFALISASYVVLALQSMIQMSIILLITATLFFVVAAGVFAKRKWAWYLAYALLLMPLIFIPVAMISKATALRAHDIILLPAFFLLCLAAFKMLRQKAVRKQYGVAGSFEEDIAERVK